VTGRRPAGALSFGGEVSPGKTKVSIASRNKFRLHATGTAITLSELLHESRDVPITLHTEVRHSADSSCECDQLQQFK
jgi:hypothetical protein